MRVTVAVASFSLLFFSCFHAGFDRLVPECRGRILPRHHQLLPHPYELLFQILLRSRVVGLSKKALQLMRIILQVEQLPVVLSGP